MVKPIQCLVCMVFGPEGTDCKPQDVIQIQINLKSPRTELTPYHVKSVISKNWIILTGVLRIEYM